MKMSKKEKTKWKADILERLSMIRRFIEDSEHCLRTAKISYMQYRRDLEWASDELTRLEEDIKAVRGRSILDEWFGSPLETVNENFNKEVHDAIDDVYGTED